MKIIVFGKITRLRASQRHGGAGRFFLNFSVIDSPRGRPVGGGIQHDDEYKVLNLFNMFLGLLSADSRSYFLYRLKKNVKNF